MYNWSSDFKNIDKKSEEFTIFSLEQAINFGLKNTKISKDLLKKYWDKLNLDPKRKEFLSFLLWRKVS
ncbi:MAG: hypothetical protein Q8P10_01465 [bacterium]|nr:hypothetical protein [bacterium]